MIAGTGSAVARTPTSCGGGVGGQQVLLGHGAGLTPPAPDVSPRRATVADLSPRHVGHAARRDSRRPSNSGESGVSCFRRWSPLLTGWLGSRAVSVLDSGAEGPGFKSQPRRCRVIVLGKLFTFIVPLFTKHQNW